jgi:hypothetical protein
MVEIFLNLDECLCGERKNRWVGNYKDYDEGGTYDELFRTKGAE